MPVDLISTLETLSPEERADAVIERRTKNIAAWLKENGPQCVREQKHLDSGSQERLYWHYGYMVALRDVQNLLKRRNRAMN